MRVVREALLDAECFHSVGILGEDQWPEFQRVLVDAFEPRISVSFRQFNHAILQDWHVLALESVSAHQFNQDDVKAKQIMAVVSRVL